MWVPKDVDEIEAAATAGTLEETSSFDGKEALPTKNAETAKDVAAMSTDGGTILFGIGEDAHQRLTKLTPIQLSGAGDRIGQIVATSIAEVPHTEMREYACPNDPSRGYLAVIVPQSARAPHQVTVGKDHRYYGRGPKGNRILSEAEVARLYERRQSWSVSRDRLLDECIAAAPLEPHARVGYVHAFARPVAGDSGLWTRAMAAIEGESGMRNLLSHAAASSPVMRTFDPSLGSGSLSWQRVDADSWRLSKWTLRERQEWADDPSSLVETTLSVDGSARMFCGRGTDILRGDRAVIMEVIIAGNVGGFLAALSSFYNAAGYHGHVDVGVAVTGISGAGSLRRQSGCDDVRYGSAEYRATARFAALELSDHEARTRDLLGRFFEASSGLAGYDPFSDLRG